MQPYYNYYPTVTAGGGGGQYRKPAPSSRTLNSFATAGGSLLQVRKLDRKLVALMPRV